ncbi:hypothetical protein AVEN_162332-1 [Araneus ventricosus]|uniref:Uncharacterized protein n=1 Tax=Araneus ventricosus TaxID=182803 RepID=A0A4Y2PBM2_ARAVE|nr:hypothetical protein AVEN_62590-1 [Araneus ventricosus]GBN49387.1 hypothetical protein AVEN_162332-1 [Araneus ventricosus]
MFFLKEVLLQSETNNSKKKYKPLAIFPPIHHRHLYIYRTMKSISRNHSVKNRCPESEGSSLQPAAPLHCFRSDVPIVLNSMQKKGKAATEGPHADLKTAIMAISLEGFCSWTIMQDPT